MKKGGGFPGGRTAAIVLLMVGVLLLFSGPVALSTEEKEMSASENKQFLYILEATDPRLATAPTAEEEAILGRHFEYLKQANEQGRLTFTGRCLDIPLAMGVLEFASLEEARDLMNNDPAVRAGLMRVQVHPLKVIFGRAVAH